jgi:hypothetical protein
MRYMAESLGIPGETFIIVAGDTVDAIEDTYASSILSPTSGLPAVNLLIQAAKVTANDSNVNYVFGDDVEPDQAGAGYKLTAGGDPVVLRGYKMIKTFHFISATNGTPGTIYATPFFEKL